MTSEERTVTTTNRMLLSYDDEYYTYATGVKTGSLNESRLLHFRHGYV